jgi:hypothetical protein
VRSLVLLCAARACCMCGRAQLGRRLRRGVLAGPLRAWLPAAVRQRPRSATIHSGAPLLCLHCRAVAIIAAAAAVQQLLLLPRQAGRARGVAVAGRLRPAVTAPAMCHAITRAARTAGWCSTPRVAGCVALLLLLLLLLLLHVICPVLCTAVLLLLLVLLLLTLPVRGMRAPADAGVVVVRGLRRWRWPLLPEACSLPVVARCVVCGGWRPSWRGRCCAAVAERARRQL